MRGFSRRFSGLANQRCLVCQPVVLFVLKSAKGSLVEDTSFDLARLQPEMRFQRCRGLQGSFEPFVTQGISSPEINVARKVSRSSLLNSKAVASLLGPRYDTSFTIRFYKITTLLLSLAYMNTASTVLNLHRFCSLASFTPGLCSRLFFPAISFCRPIYKGPRSSRAAFIRLDLSMGSIMHDGKSSTAGWVSFERKNIF
jgi:hypothetical protein